MRIITKQLIQDNSPVPLNEVEYLDLSGKLLCDVGGLASCPQLRTVILRDNNIEFLRNLDQCVHLWNIDLTGNRMKILSGLNCFPILGSLYLGSNELDWQSLEAIKQIIILKLSLAGNPKIDSDPHYRAHAVEVLPNVWVLDGIQITAKERKDVKNFFRKSGATSRPIRPKFGNNIYVSSYVKNVFKAGAVGKAARHLMSEFPPSYVQTTEWDKKRQNYLLYLIQEDILMAKKYYNKLAFLDIASSQSKIETVPILKDILQVRLKPGMKEKVNMLLLLIVAGLEFDMPTEVLRITMEVITLEVLGHLFCIDLFQLPYELNRDVSSLLLSAEKMDRDFKINDGGLYDKLYTALCFAVENLYTRPARQPREPVIWQNPVMPKKLKRLSKDVVTEWNSVIACEIVELMCMVPPFLDGVRTDYRLMDIVARAKGETNVSEIVKYLEWKAEEEQGGLFQFYHDMSRYLNCSGRKFCQRYQQGVHRTSSAIFPLHRISKADQPSSSAVTMNFEKHAKQSRMAPKSAKEVDKHRKPIPGEIVCVDDKLYTKIVAVPQGRIAVIRHELLASKPHVRPEDGFFYCKTKEMYWDKQHKYWIATFSNPVPLLHVAKETAHPRKHSIAHNTFFGTKADRIAANKSFNPKSLYYEDPKIIFSEKDLPVEDGMANPNKFAFYKSMLHEDSPSRHYPVVPSSSPTEEVLYRDDQGLSLVSVSSESDYQKSILQGYSGHCNGSSATASGTDFEVTIPTSPVSIDSTNSDPTEHPQTCQNTKATAEADGECSGNPPESRQEGETSSGKAGQGILLDVPTPKVKLNEIWEVDKSLPNCAIASRGLAHSCMLDEVQALTLEEMDATTIPEPLHVASVYAGLHFSTQHGKPVIPMQPYQYRCLREGVTYDRSLVGGTLNDQVLNLGKLNEADNAALQYAVTNEPTRIVHRREPPRLRRPPSKPRPRPSTSFMEVRGVSSRMVPPPGRPHTTSYAPGNLVYSNGVQSMSQTTEDVYLQQRPSRRSSGIGQGVRKLGGGKPSLV